MIGAADRDSGCSLGNGESIRRGLGGGLIGGRGEAVGVIRVVGVGGPGTGIEVVLSEGVKVTPWVATPAEGVVLVS